MKIRSLMVPALVAGVLSSACATTGATAPLNSFAEFITAAEAAVVGGREQTIVSSTPHVGRDFAITAGKVHPGVAVQYNFRVTPCVTPAMVQDALTGLSYSPPRRSSDTHGAQQTEPPERLLGALRETYSFPTTVGNRSANASYAKVEGRECATALFIDYPEKRS